MRFEFHPSVLDSLDRRLNFRLCQFQSLQRGYQKYASRPMYHQGYLNHLMTDKKSLFWWCGQMPVETGLKKRCHDVKGM